MNNITVLCYGEEENDKIFSFSVPFNESEIHILPLFTDTITAIKFMDDFLTLFADIDDSMMLVYRICERNTLSALLTTIACVGRVTHVIVDPKCSFELEEVIKNAISIESYIESISDN